MSNPIPAILLLASLAPAQSLLLQGNLGGGCVPPLSSLSYAGFGNDQLRFFDDGGGVLIDGILGPGAADPAIQITFLSPYDPTGTWPSCGCTLHTTLDIAIVGAGGNGDVVIAYPPAIGGVTIFAQCAYIPTLPLGFGCSEVWVLPVLSDGFWVTLP